MKPIPHFMVASLISLVAGFSTTQVSRGPVKADAHFTVAHYDSSQVDVPAKLTSFASPRPRAGNPPNDVEGYAIVQFIVDADGIPREVQWVKASDELFASLAATAVAESRYRPARKGGKAVAVKMEARIATPVSRTTAVTAGDRYDDHDQPTRYAEEVPTAYGPTAGPFPNSNLSNHSGDNVSYSSAGK